ncbi:MAG TPA: hypothetical protein VIS94_07780 [Desulfomonilia bacterium]
MQEKNILNINGKGALTAHGRIFRMFLVIFTIFVFMTIANELLDLPRYLFGDQPTSFSQRKGEVILEIFIYLVVLSAAFYVFEKKIKTQIKILEGFIPICANCKKIRQDIDWKVLEDYISENSLAKFSHTICPDCIRKLYPELSDRILANHPDNGHGKGH